MGCQLNGKADLRLHVTTYHRFKSCIAHFLLEIQALFNSPLIGLEEKGG